MSFTPADAAKIKITAVDIFVYDIPLQQPFRIAIGTMEAANDVLIRIHTDAGLVGLGEACPFPPITGETQATNIAAAKAVREIVLGRNPLEAVALLRDIGPLAHSNPSLTAAFDTACHDILGQAAGLPLYRLWGGSRTEFETDITADLDTPEAMASRAAGFVAAGFKMIKIKVGQSREIDLERLRSIRDAVGAGIRLQIDANQGWSPSTAKDALKKMERFDILFCEQPVRASDVDGLREVRRASPIPIMADEAVYGPADAARLIKAEACDSINIKLMKAGSLQAMRIMAHAAEAANMPCMVGCMLESRLALTAAAHVVASHPNILWADLDGHSSHKIDPVVGGMAFGRGRVKLPEGPGLGASIDPAFLDKLTRV
jgi:L-alanine-DL-glutamate epimerase-like enolase superfamily enzyme